MNSQEFRRFGYDVIDYIANYKETLGGRAPLANVRPGYLSKLVPLKPPEKAEEWSQILSDMENVIMPGVTHSQHPNFHASSSENSFPSILGSFLSNAFGASCGSWPACPAGTELEMIVLDWVAKFLNLPPFLYSPMSDPSSKGGGAILNSEVECILVTMVAAREAYLQKLSKAYPQVPRAVLNDKLIAYCSNQAHRGVQVAAKIAQVRLRILQPGPQASLTTEILHDAIVQDKTEEFIPFFLVATIGSASVNSVDDLIQIGPVCQYHDIFLHVDCSYAGACFSCPEFRYLQQGLEFCSSLNMDCSKWMLTSFDCSLLWVKRKRSLEGPMSAYHPPECNVPEYRNWGIGNTRRFLALKLWFVLRTYGISGLRKHIRNHCCLTKRFAHNVLRDDRFSVIGDTRFGLCSFAFKGYSELSNKLNRRLLEAINSSRKILLSPSTFSNKFLMRMCITYEFANEEHIDYAWQVIQEYAGIIKYLYAIDMKELSKDIERLDNQKLDLSSYQHLPKDSFQLRRYLTQKSMGIRDIAVLLSSRTLPEQIQAADSVLQPISSSQSDECDFSLKGIGYNAFDKIEGSCTTSCDFKS